MRKVENPYNVDVEYELRTYSYVVGSHRMSKRRKRKPYKQCNAYSEWEKHIIESAIPKDQSAQRYVDFQHWIKMMKRQSEIWISVFEGIVIPGSIVVLEVFQLSDAPFFDVVLLVAAVFAMAYWTKEYEKARIQAYFWSDYLSVVKKYDDKLSKNLTKGQNFDGSGSY